MYSLIKLKYFIIDLELNYLAFLFLYTLLNNPSNIFNVTLLCMFFIDTIEFLHMTFTL